jgi:hypothetical protein
VAIKTVTELIAHAKANPGRTNMGSAGIGSTGHLADELFKMMAGVNLIHVPIRGNAPALTDLITGHIEVLFPSLGSSIEFLKTGCGQRLGLSGSMVIGVVAENNVERQAPRTSVLAAHNLGKILELHDLFPPLLG